MKGLMNTARAFRNAQASTSTAPVAIARGPGRVQSLRQHRRIHTSPSTTPSSSGSRLGLSVAGASAAVVASTLYFSSLRPLALDSAVSLKGVDRIIDREEISQHKFEDSLWVIIDGDVWDVTEFVMGHPAGAEVILEQGGKDITSLFQTLHPKGTLDKIKPMLKKVGKASKSSESTVAAPSDVDEVEQRRADLMRPDLVINVGEFENLAKGVLGEESTAWSMIFSWADDGASFSSARDSWSFIRFLPRVNRSVKDIDTSTSFVNNKQTVPFPIFMAPTGGSGVAHPEGELNLTRAAAKTLIPQCVSSAASKSISEVLDERDAIVAAGGAKAPIWFQLYIRTDRKESERILREVVAKGVEAIMITVDVPTLGNREAHAHETRRKAIKEGTANQPVKLQRVGAQHAMAALFDPNMSWDDIAWVKSLAPGVPVLIKGLNSVADVELAHEHGADGVVLSTHGARQLDHTSPPIATLVRLRDEAPHVLKDSKFEVYVDGGITRGTDILKALCLGAKGVGIGRTMLYAQACYGEAGVLRACEILESEVIRGMRLLGATKVSELRPGMVEVLDGLVGRQMKEL